MIDFQDKKRNREFFRLYGKCQNDIYSIILMLVHNESDAEDLLQDTAATMLEKFDDFSEGTNFTGWAITIAKNKALNFLKRNARMRPVLSDDVYNRLIEIETHEDKLLSDRSDALKKCCQKLSDKDKDILMMRYYKEYSMKKISETLGRSKTGIYHSMARIHALLYKCVKSDMAGGQM